ncbi:GDSL esterase/lipase At5g55050 [Ricinus communis]|uniref:GDSL esterase/lipase At5g55050 n=1 Tax=Ricinus communis TaxID=3988 RepID=UPI00201AB2B6|nr:GDSL esterase/lipase At5g55050 [Ricinus communis]
MANTHIFSSYFLLFVQCIFATGYADLVSTRTLPAIFIFGDSAIDIGTNNYLNSYARANFPYNGIDFPHSKSTGRFSNGYNIGDQLAMKFGFKKSPPAFLDLLNHTTIDFKKKVQRGVNFASAGAGILDETGFKAWNQVVKLSEQIQQFRTVIGNITVVKGPEATAKILSKAFYIFCLGSNEFFDYMRAKSNTPKEQLLATIQSAYYLHLKNIYNMGARRFGVIGVPPIGCCPYARAINIKEGGGDVCMPLLNDLAQAFYNSTLTLLQGLSSELPNLKYSFGNAYAMTTDLFDKFPNFGFKDIKTACCGSGNYNGEYPCYKPINPNLCKNRSEYLFWDMYHPSQAASQLLADSLYKGDTNYMTPMNFSQLAEVEVHI